VAVRLARKRRIAPVLLEVSEPRDKAQADDQQGEDDPDAEEDDDQEDHGHGVGVEDKHTFSMHVDLRQAETPPRI
jgi:hypothetical protein